MQVSWIDPDEVRELVSHLQGPPPSARTAGSGGQSQPGTEGFFAFDLITGQPASPPWDQEAAPEDKATGSGTGEPSPEVAMIREKLRNIRDRAQQAGLLQTEPMPKPEPAPAAAAPMPSPLRKEAPVPSPSPALPPVEGPAALPAASQRVVAQPVLTHEVPSASPPGTFLPMGGTMAERLANFAAWAARFTTSEELMILDDHGDLLWGSPTRDELIVSAMLAVNAALRASVGSTARPAPLLLTSAGAGRELSIVSCTTRYGQVTLALVNPKNTPADTLREALALAIEK